MQSGRSSQTASPMSGRCLAKGRSGWPASRRSTGSTSRAGRSSGSIRAGERTTWETPFRICSLAPRRAGGFIAGTERGFAAVDLDVRSLRRFRRSRARPPGQSLQRRQARPRGPLLGRDDGRSGAGGDGLALSARSRPAWQRFDDGYQGHQRPRLQPRRAAGCITMIRRSRSPMFSTSTRTASPPTGGSSRAMARATAIPTE